MLRLFLFVLIFIFFFIVYYIVRTLLTANRILRSSKKEGTKRGSRYKNIEEADFKEIDTNSNKKNDKDVQE
jgi:uncharacterized membrane protein